MANDAVLQRIRDGSETWNNWRKENPNELIDLRGIELGDIKLPNIDLSSSNLEGVR